MFPMQPIKDGHFVKNRIVEALFKDCFADMVTIENSGFTHEELIQFYQLMGKSLVEFSGLPCVTDTECGIAGKIAEKGITEVEATNEVLRKTIEDTKQGVRLAAAALFDICSDDLGV